MATATSVLPQAFVWRRLHSLMGLWIVLFLIEHLLTNSQAALFFGESGRGFVEMVDFLHNLPYLQVIEITLLGVPIAIHLIWGIKYLLTAKFNSFRTDGSAPSLPEYGRNRAYTWQRITSWILAVGLIGHVAKFRFLEYPVAVNLGSSPSYFVRVSMDNGLYTVASRLGVSLYDKEAVEEEREQLQMDLEGQSLFEAVEPSLKEERSFNESEGAFRNALQDIDQRIAWIQGLEKRPLSRNEVIAEANNFGTASLLAVRDTFKSPIYVALYTIFVLAACFHAFNGFWTFLITWGVVLKMAAQKAMVKFAVGLMVIIAFLGLAAVWGTYWLNLKY